MPRSTGQRDAHRSVVFAPLDGTGRAELVARRLSDAIISGLLRDGEKLPSEADLARSMGVALVTAREALEVLRVNSLVETRRGREGGSFVTYDKDAARRVLDQRLQGGPRQLGRGHRVARDQPPVQLPLRRSIHRPGRLSPGHLAAPVPRPEYGTWKPRAAYP